MVAGGGVEAAGRGGVGGGGVGGGGGLGRDEARLLGAGGRGGAAGAEAGGGGELLALAAAGGGDPRALDVGRAVEAAALAARPAAPVGAVLLRLVAAILAGRRRPCQPDPRAAEDARRVEHRDGLPHIGDGNNGSAKVRVLGELRGRELRLGLPELDAGGGGAGLEGNEAKLEKKRG
ncbi:uncharacterized protein LOC109727583 [Ananas comosus]|uniref:Uncharacterized protein LOC109727583 n=1 Tax=Ananas comosus TaxID=4615 RepID=A0A6P5HBQ9_ANACO|nr:uncharacterized protein LOC109727583 [Ananas comosus]